jgi:hypothetical protein
MFSVLKTSIFLLWCEKYIKIHQGNAVYFSALKLAGSLLVFHGGNAHFRLILPKKISQG